MTIMDGFRFGLGLIGACVSIFCVFGVVVNIYHAATSGTKEERG